MIRDNSLQVNHLFSTGGASTTYVQIPKESVVLNVRSTLQGDPGDSETLTITENSASTAIGAIAFGDDVAAGDIGTYTADATDGGHVIAAGEILKIVGSTATAAANVFLDIELDPYAK